MNANQANSDVPPSRQQVLYLQPGQPIVQPYVQPVYAGGAYPVVYQQIPGQIIAQPVMASQPIIMACQPGRQPLSYVNDPLTELSSLSKVIIEQQIELLEILTGCETKNRYHVIGIDNNQVPKFLFLCKEESSWCMRNCCYASLRSFSMLLKHVAAQNIHTIDWAKPFAKFEKPFKCTCCCLGRPMMEMYIGENKVSIITEPFTCCKCDPFFKIYDKNNILKYTIRIDCCQCGYVCANSMAEACSNVEMIIYKQDNLKNPVGKVIKKAKGFQELYTDADTYVINFPVDATPEDKLAMIGCTLLIDYRYYETSGNNENERGGYYGRGYYGRRGYYY